MLSNILKHYGSSKPVLAPKPPRRITRNHQFSLTLMLNKILRQLAPSKKSKGHQEKISVEPVNLVELAKPEISSKILISNHAPYISCRLCQKEKMMQ